jgi:hypothetical protein
MPLIVAAISLQSWALVAGTLTMSGIVRWISGIPFLGHRQIVGKYYHFYPTIETEEILQKHDIRSPTFDPRQYAHESEIPAPSPSPPPDDLPGSSDQSVTPKTRDHSHSEQNIQKWVSLGDIQPRSFR